MSYNKDEYEKLIDASPLFSLDKEKEQIAYKREALKMVENLYCYLMAANASKYDAYAVEIVDTAKRCIENYNPKTGRFLNYFLAAWKQTYGHLIGKELVKETFVGIHFTKEEERSFKKYMRLAQSLGINIESSEFDERVAEAMGITTADVDSLRRMINCKPMSGNYVSDEGEEYSLIDQLDSGSYTDTGILHLETAKEFLDIIEITYDQLQERQKPMLAMLITSKIAFGVNEYDKLLPYIMKKSFFDEDIYEESLKRGELIQAKEIAERFGVVEASASRTWKTFKEKVNIKRKSELE